MSALSVCYKVGRFRKSFSFKFKNLRFLSTEEAALKGNTQVTSRKYLKPSFTRNLKTLNENFLRDLFRDTIDKNIFLYPSILRNEDVNVVLSQTSEIESFLINNLNAELTEEIVTKLKELELFGLSVPQKYGGAGYTKTEAKFLLECSGINPSIGRFLSYHDVGCNLIELYGNEKQKEKYLTRLAAGESFITLAYLENDPLIDLSKFEGNGIILEKEKQFMLGTEKKWVHHADKADLFLVMVKTSSYNTDTEEVKVKFSMFIVDRKTQGVTVHKSLIKNLQDCDLYDVSFKNVHVPFENVLGDLEADGFEALKSGLSHSSINDAVLCCSLIKSIIHDLSKFIDEKGLSDTKIRSNGLLQENLASISTYAFGLESLIYLVTGRFDMYKNPDLFNESILVKILAIDILYIVIKKYVGTVGRESFKASGLLEKALHTLHYCSVLDENIEYLKMMVVADGLLHSATTFVSRHQIFKRPYDHPLKAMKFQISTPEGTLRKWKKIHNFKNEIPAELTISADTLEENCAQFKAALEHIFYTEGTQVMNNESFMVNFAEAAAYIYAAVACLARASNSYCYNFEGYQNDIVMAKAFAVITDAKMSVLGGDDFMHTLLDECYRVIGKMTFNRKEYPAEHPLSRTY